MLSALPNCKYSGLASLFSHCLLNAEHQAGKPQTLIIGFTQHGTKSMCTGTILLGTCYEFFLLKLIKSKGFSQKDRGKKKNIFLPLFQ